MSDSQPNNKLKIVLLDERYKKSLKNASGFVFDKGAKDENTNSIFINTAVIKKFPKDFIAKSFMHETVHTIINDNIRNGKIKNRPSLLLEEAICESATILDGYNRREAINLNDLLIDKYYFVSNLMKYFYLKNDRKSDIFKDIVSDIENKGFGSFYDAVKSTGNKVGVDGDFDTIIKHFVKDKFKATEEEAKQVLSEFYERKDKKNW